MEKIYEYKPSGVCSSKIIFTIDNNIIKKIKVIECGFKNTSCPDQISKALEQYKKEN